MAMSCSDLPQNGDTVVRSFQFLGPGSGEPEDQAKAADEAPFPQQLRSRCPLFCLQFREDARVFGSPAQPFRFRVAGKNDAMILHGCKIAAMQNCEAIHGCLLSGARYVLPDNCDYLTWIMHAKHSAKVGSK